MALFRRSCRSTWRGCRRCRRNDSFLRVGGWLYRGTRRRNGICDRLLRRGCFSCCLSIRFMGWSDIWTRLGSCLRGHNFCGRRGCSSPIGSTWSDFCRSIMTLTLRLERTAAGKRGERGRRLLSLCYLTSFVLPPTVEIRHRPLN